VRGVAHHGHSAFVVRFGREHVEESPDVGVFHHAHDRLDRVAPALEVGFDVVLGVGHNPVRIVPGLARAERDGWWFT